MNLALLRFIRHLRAGLRKLPDGGKALVRSVPRAVRLAHLMPYPSSSHDVWLGTFTRTLREHLLASGDWRYGWQAGQRPQAYDLGATRLPGKHWRASAGRVTGLPERGPSLLSQAS